MERTDPNANAVAAIARLDAALWQQPNDAPAFTADQIQLLKDSVCVGATDDEFKVFLEVCKRKKLDPFSKQIYAIKRWDSNTGRNAITYQTSIDGFRFIAERSGKMRGHIPTEWCGADGNWVDVWLSHQPPMAARCGVRREGYLEPVVCVATFRSYVQTKKDGNPNAVWQKMPDVMTAKCAEALALRKAFPDDLAGLYTHDEMGQAPDDLAGLYTHDEMGQADNEPVTIRATARAARNHVVPAAAAAPAPLHAPEIAEDGPFKELMHAIFAAPDEEALLALQDAALALPPEQKADARELYKAKLVECRRAAYDAQRAARAATVKRIMNELPEEPPQEGE